MIKAILIDDELHSMETLKIEISRHVPNIEIIGTANSGEKGIALINSLKPDLVFLDIEMPWMNGFEMLQKLGKVDFNLIFVTAYDSYAIEAFKFSAMGYILKPVQKEDLIEAMERLDAEKSSGISDTHFQNLIENLSHRNAKFPKIALSTAESFEFVRVDNILRCEADKNYTNIFLKDNTKFFLAKTLKEIEAMLKNHGFIRTHQSHLINPMYIKRFVKSDGGYIIMEDGSQVAVARARKDKLMEYINKM
jgi:two-component system LytT family response regulator